MHRFFFTAYVIKGVYVSVECVLRVHQDHRKECHLRKNHNPKTNFENITLKNRMYRHVPIEFI